MASTLTPPQQRVLGTLTRYARCVGAARTDEQVGYVNVTAARALVDQGLARDEVSATGARVFVLTPEGHEAAAEALA